MTSEADDESLDARIEVVTPENIAVHYRVAGPVRRALALLLDIALLLAIMMGLTFVVQFIGIINTGFAMGVYLVLNFLLYWFFFGFQEAYFNGRTLGKKTLGLRVITVDGQPINGLQALMRNFLRLPTFMMPVVDLITMTLNDRFQRLGDLACGTVVVVEDRSWLFGVAKLDDPRCVQLAAYIPANFEVTKSLAKALSTYVERRKFFSPARCREVARHIAEPLLKKFGLPPDTSYDLLLCTLYYRAFIADRGDDEKQAAAISQQNPFAVMGQSSAQNQYGPPALFPTGTPAASPGEITFTSPLRSR
jgi:uncharacterized RDD family membrane protein YckC